MVNKVSGQHRQIINMIGRQGLMCCMATRLMWCVKGVRGWKVRIAIRKVVLPGVDVLKFSAVSRMSIVLIIREDSYW